VPWRREGVSARHCRIARHTGRRSSHPVIWVACRPRHKLARSALPRERFSPLAHSRGAARREWQPLTLPRRTLASQSKTRL